MLLRQPVIGLFGTCGGSTWRDAFIREYEMEGVQYYNPNKLDWKPEYAAEETEHMIKDEIILFPVLGETYGTASLPEIGHSLLTILRSNTSRFVVTMIDPECDPALKVNEHAFKESNRARSIVRSHIKALELPNLFMVEDLATMLMVSLHLHQACKSIYAARDIESFAFIKRVLEDI